MQLYFTHTNPKQAANYLAENYPHKVGHTIKEGMQILGSVAHRYNTPLPLTIDGKEYGVGYKDHPITKWTGNNQKNFEWVWQYLMYLGERNRHGSLINEHADNLEITWNTYYELPPAKRRQPFPNCAKADGKKDFTHITPTTEAYQLYLESQVKNK